MLCRTKWGIRMRYLITEQFLGMIFSSLIEKDVFEIPLSDLSELEEQADRVLRKRNKTVLMLCSNDGFWGSEEYEEFFCVVEKKISLQKRLKENDDKKSILEKIADCFTVGIPRDIKNTLTETVNNYTMGS